MARPESTPGDRALAERRERERMLPPRAREPNRFGLTWRAVVVFGVLLAVLAIVMGIAMTVGD